MLTLGKPALEAYHLPLRTAGRCPTRRCGEGNVQRGRLNDTTTRNGQRWGKWADGIYVAERMCSVQVQLQPLPTCRQKDRTQPSYRLFHVQSVASNMPGVRLPLLLCTSTTAVAITRWVPLKSTGSQKRRGAVPQPKKKAVCSCSNSSACRLGEPRRQQQKESLNRTRISRHFRRRWCRMGVCTRPLRS
jgi:hypothetical protein